MPASMAVQPEKEYWVQLDELSGWEPAQMVVPCRMAGPTRENWLTHLESNVTVTLEGMPGFNEGS